jgi:hypothetical protein
MEAVRRTERRADTYDYQPALRAADAVEWHVNFSDPELFVAYGTRLLAQDEMQVAEHPVLGALREALAAQGHSTRTEEGGCPTPVLVLGAERRCRIATNPDAALGRPKGLYGNAFACASEEAIRLATTAIVPPTHTNIIAIAAPPGGSGRYTARQINAILITAYTGFRAAVLQAGNSPVAVHTGFWGCGAFGGSRQLMAMLQVISAGMAGVGRLVFHAFDAAGGTTFDDAIRRIERDLGDGSIPSADLVTRIAALGCEWGVSDGN